MTLIFQARPDLDESDMHNQGRKAREDHLLYWSRFPHSQDIGHQLPSIGG